MKRRHNPIVYYMFYLLFSEDTWRILLGFIMTVIIAPRVTAGRGYTTMGEVVVWLMLLAIGYAASNYPARWISKGLQRIITPKR